MSGENKKKSGERSTLFNTTEKSNFILNMRESTVRKMTVLFLAFTPVAIALCVFLNNIDIISMQMVSIALSLGGMMGFVGVSIIQAKKLADKSQILPFALCGAIFLFGLISSFAAFDFSKAVSGNYGRFEGFLSIACYLGIFLLAMQIQRKRGMRAVMDVIVAVAAAQCVIAIIEAVDLFHYSSNFSAFQNLSYTGDENTLGILLPAGMSGSPIFLAGYLSLACGISAFGSCYDLYLPRRIAYTAATILFIAVAVDTHSLIAVLGIGTVLAVSFVLEIIRIIRGLNEHYKKTTFPVIHCVIYLVCFVSVMLIVYSGGGLYDGGIMWQDSFLNLAGVSGMYYPNTADYPDRAPFDILKLNEVYGYLWSNTLEGMKKYSLWLTGSGADCLYYTQLKTTSEIMVENYSFDKCYNDYLYIAATRGIPSLIAYCALLGVCVKRVFAGVKEMLLLQKNELWVYGAVFASILSYIIFSFFNASSVTVAPVFWILLGFASKKNILSSGTKTTVKQEDTEKTAADAESQR